MSEQAKEASAAAPATEEISECEKLLDRGLDAQGFHRLRDALGWLML